MNIDHFKSFPVTVAICPGIVRKVWVGRPCSKVRDAFGHLFNVDEPGVMVHGVLRINGKPASMLDDLNPNDSVVFIALEDDKRADLISLHRNIYPKCLGAKLIVQACGHF